MRKQRCAFVVSAKWRKEFCFMQMFALVEEKNSENNEDCKINNHSFTPYENQNEFESSLACAKGKSKKSHLKGIHFVVQCFQRG